MHPQQLAQEVQGFCQEIKSANKLYRDQTMYPNELIISSFMSEDEIMALHNSCHCFVNTSHGEAWSYPTFDAMATGNSIISPNIGGLKDFLGDYNWGFDINGEYKSVFGMHKENFINYNSSKEKWFDCDIADLRCRMRQCYEAKVGVQKNSDGIKIANKYTRKNVGNLMKDLLNA
jgi:glycosyltransferase involved in cell wall biosynthesis